MNRIRVLRVLCVGCFVCGLVFAAPPPPETLKLSDLINHPERLPATVTLKKSFKFSGGKSASAGQQVQLIEFRGGPVGVDAGNNLAFEVQPNDCDLLEAANAAWAKLTPAQRAVDMQILMQDASIWPDKIKCTLGFKLDNGKDLPPGGEYELIAIKPDGVQMWYAPDRMNLMADLPQTDAIARAREKAAIDPDKRPSRIADALRKILVDADGKRAAGESLDQTKIFALYYGASWCQPCRQFSPGFVKYINGVAEKNPHLSVVLMSNDKEDAELFKYMKEEKMPWPAITLKDLNNSPIFLSYAGTGIPQLVVVDRYGKVLANSFENGQNFGPQRSMQTLKRLVDSGAAK